MQASTFAFGPHQESVGALEPEKALGASPTLKKGNARSAGLVEHRWIPPCFRLVLCCQSIFPKGHLGQGTSLFSTNAERGVCFVVRGFCGRLIDPHVSFHFFPSGSSDSGSVRAVCFARRGPAASAGPGADGGHERAAGGLREARRARFRLPPHSASAALGSAAGVMCFLLDPVGFPRFCRLLATVLKGTTGIGVFSIFTLLFFCTMASICNWKRGGPMESTAVAPSSG